MTCMLLTVACGEIKDPDTATDSLWTIRGNIRLPSSDIADQMELTDLRIALVWRVVDDTVTDAGGMISYTGISQEIPITSEFPLQFKLEIDELLPREKLIPISSDHLGIMPPRNFYDWGHPRNYENDQFDFRYTYGQLVVYRDQNKNGKLDFVTEEDEDFIDHIVGGAFNYDFYYFESDMEQIFPRRPDIKPGISVFYRPSGDWPTRRIISLEEEIEVAIFEHTLNQLFMCEEGVVNFFNEMTHYQSAECANRHGDYTLLKEIAPEYITLGLNGICVGNGRDFVLLNYNSTQVETLTCNFDNIYLGLFETGIYPMPKVSEVDIFRVPPNEDLPEYWPCELGEFPSTTYDIHVDLLESWLTCGVVYEQDTETEPNVDGWE